MSGSSNPLRRAALKAVLAVREVHGLGLGTSNAIVGHSIEMALDAWRERRTARGPATTRSPGRLVSALPIEDRDRDGALLGAHCLFTEGELELRFLDDGLVRITWGPGELPVPWALAVDPGELRPRGNIVWDDGGSAVGCRLHSPSMAIEVGRGGDVTMRSPQGHLLRRELPPLRRGAIVTSRSVLRPGEHVSGLGEQAWGVDLRGSAHRLWNRDPGGAWGPGQDPLYCGIPVLVGMHPDGDVLVFHENTYDAEVRVGGGRGSAAAAPAQVELAFAGGALRHYVAIGGLPMLLDQYTVLTGRPAMPPRWALGYHQCKWGYRSESDIREIAEGFADESVPLSAVHLDIDYMDGYRVFSIDRERFPDMPSLAGSLRERGTRLVAIVDPAVKADPSYDVYRDGVEGGHFVVGEDGHPFLGVVWPGRSAFPDFTDQATRDWWASWYRRLLDQGISGIWHDMNEPTSITLWGDRTLPSGIRHSVEGRGGDHRECHNAYGLLMDRAGWEAMKDFDGERRPFLLSRSGWAGMQRWAWNWTGDIESSWDGLHQQIATAIGLGLSGVPFTGSDIGGFSGIPDSELYLRWLELSVFMPFCRTHSVMGSPNREPWRFQEPYRSAIDRLIRFRYRLLPYLYTLARAANLHGHPFVRPLCWPDENGGSSLARPVDDAFFLGNALLVAPVTSPGASSRSVEVPTGRWYSWRALPAIINGEATDQECDVVSTVEGGRVTTIAVPPGQPGVLVREGTVLGLDDGWGSAVPEPASGSLALSHEPRLLSWHCFPKSDGSAVGVGFDDPGDGTEASRTDRMTLSGAPPVLEWEHDGGYRLPDRVRVVFHGVRASRALVDGKEVETTIRDVGELPSTVVDTVPFGRLQLASVR